jgi:thiaminase/transcriptional activator TenA
MKLSEKALLAVEDVYQEILNHPFNKQLADGTLDVELFKEYLRQDDLYLLAYAKAVAFLGTKATKPSEISYWLKNAYEGVMMENEMHDTFFQKFGIVASTEPNTACEVYSNFLLATVAFKTYEESVAAILPCFLIYQKIGEHIFQISPKDNPYQEWIDTYASQEYKETVLEAIHIFDDIAENSNENLQNIMLKTFRKATIYELLFYQGIIH